MNLDPGLYPHRTTAEHRALPMISPSSMRHLAQSPAALRRALDHPMEPTPAMILGTLVHGLVLEGLVPDGLATRPPGTDLRTSAGKRWRDELPPGTEIISEDTMEQAQAIAAAVRAHPVVAELLSAGQTEVSMVWTDTVTSTPLKGRADLIDESGLGAAIIADLKVVGPLDVYADGAARNIESGGYARQLALYCDGYTTLRDRAAEGWVIMAGREPPYPVEAYWLEPEWLAWGLSDSRKLLAQWAECVASGVYPANGTEATKLCRPRWGWARE